MRKLIYAYLAAAAALVMQPSLVVAEQALATSVADAGLQWGPCPPFFAEGCQIAVLHGDPAKPNADVFFRVPGNYDLPRHWHSSAERMILVAGELDVTYEGQATANLKTGMYAYGPPKAVHDGRCVSDEPCVLFIAFEQPVDAHEVAVAAE
ncbi:MAG: cupin domain-containing protein [Halieaceae bacterium]|nr:cupin domain-containing protein [Halieaceae bacterium]